MVLLNLKQIRLGGRKEENEATKVIKNVFELMEMKSLQDLWRERNKSVKDYTFYSASKKSSSRIYMVWDAKSIEVITKYIEILPKV